MHAEPLQCAGVGLTLPKEEIEAQSKEPKHTQSRPSSKRLGQAPSGPHDRLGLGPCAHSCSSSGLQGTSD